MKRMGSLIGFGIFFLIIGLAIGSTFLFQKQEKRYTEFLISVNPQANSQAVSEVAQKYGFKLEKQEWAFKTENSFTKKHQVYKVSKYNIRPEELSSVLKSLNKLKADKIVQAVEPNYSVKIFTNDPLYAKQWNLKQFRMEEVWKRATGKNVVVAVIDTGVSDKLGDLSAGRLVAGYNFVARNTSFQDDHGHGSHVAGTIGQDTNNGIGVAGIAYNCRIMPLKVLDARGSGTTMGIAEAIVYAVDKGAHIINMSLGGGGFSQVLKDACDYAYEQDVVVIAAAGNENSRQSSYPGRFGNVISVAAANPELERAFYSNWGAGVDVIAPGGETRSAMASGVLQNAPDFLSRNYDGYLKEGSDFFYYFQGTSMAAPHVAGIAALLWERGVHKPAEMRNLLVSGSNQKIAELPLVDPLTALDRIGKSTDDPAAKIPPVPGKHKYNTGPVTTSTSTTLLTLLIAFGLFILFDRTRKKVNAIENLIKPATFIGLALGAGGLSLAGYFLQGLFPFTILPERFTGLLFNSLLDYDRVLFFLSAGTPFWHNFLIPVFFMIILNFQDQAKRRFTTGLLLGFSAKLVSEGLLIHEMTFFPDGIPALLFLVINGLITFALPYVLVKNE